MSSPSDAPTTGLHADAKPAIVLSDVTVAHKGAPVILGVRWEVLSHTVTALLGPTGSGKSTLLAAPAGALPPTGGTIALGGRDPAKAATRRSIGFMPQTGGLYADLSVDENMEVFSAGSGARSAALEKALEVVQLKQRRRELVRELSAGYQQRVSLAVALAGNAQYLLLDDPFGLADHEFAERLRAHLKGLAADGHAVLLTTARVDVAARADVVGLLRNGRLVANEVVGKLATGGRGKVVMTFREKTGTRRETHAVQNYRQELVPLVTNAGTKPFEVDFQPETLEEQLTRLLTEDPHARA